MRMFQGLSRLVSRTFHHLKGLIIRPVSNAVFVPNKRKETILLARMSMSVKTKLMIVSKTRCVKIQASLTLFQSIKFSDGSWDCECPEDGFLRRDGQCVDINECRGFVYTV